MLLLQDSRIHGLCSQVLELAEAQGVQRMACNGCHEGDWGKVWPDTCDPWLTSLIKHIWLELTSDGHTQVVELAAQHPQIIPNFGLHPW